MGGPENLVLNFKSERKRWSEENDLWANSLIELNIIPRELLRYTLNISFLQFDILSNSTIWKPQVNFFPRNQRSKRKWRKSIWSWFQADNRTQITDFLSLNYTRYKERTLSITFFFVTKNLIWGCWLNQLLWINLIHIERIHIMTVYCTIEPLSTRWLHCV